MSSAERIKVLYIEDNFSNRMLVRRVLEAEGIYDMIDAEDGMSGIARAQQEQPDLVLLDINIPGMDGYEVATRLKSMPGLRQTPVVALTAKTMRGDRERALSAGCDGYIMKPINIDTFPVEIAEFLRGKKETLGASEERLYLREHSQRFAERLEAKVAELTQLNVSLREGDRLKSKFIALAAHELRTPLTVINGYLGMLKSMTSSDRPISGESCQAMVGGVERGVERLSAIVNNMVDVTRIEAGNLQLNPTWVTVSDSVASVVRDLSSAIDERQHSVTVIALDQLPKLWADNQRLYQVFNNLISNAIKYTRDGGKIQISGEVLQPGGAKPLPPTVTDLTTDYVEVVVADNGIGIAETDRERIFQRFYEVKDDALHSTSQHQFLGGGVGLGLAIARGIVEAHGGWLWAESEGYDLYKCPGSRFHVLMPVRSTRKSAAQG